MPLCKAGLATVGLFIALNYWNDWYDAMLFLDEGAGTCTRCNTS